MSENNKKTVEEMSNHELLEELVRMDRRRDRLIIALCILGIVLAAVLITAVIILVPRTLQSLESIEESMKVVDQMAVQADASLQEPSKIDFDQLNQGISDFSKIVSSLAKFFGK